MDQDRFARGDGQAHELQRNERGARAGDTARAQRAAYRAAATRDPCDDFVKVVVVRDPLERLLSAYLDKCHHTP